jgi:NTP pyrophosphatase (non-canonical NTP hydrolase)
MAKTTLASRITDQDLADFEDGGTFDDYMRLASRTAIYPGQRTALGLVYVALKLNGEAGEFAEHVGKAIRDDGIVTLVEEWDCEDEDCNFSAYLTRDYLTPKRREALIKELGDICWYVANACRELNIRPTEVLRRNLVKLADRAARNKLQGSGDDR